MDQLTMVANPARSQLHRGKYVSLCPRSRLRIWPRDTGLVVPSRVRLLVIHTRMLNLVLQYVRIVSIKSARGQLNTENEYFPVPVRARELGLARQLRAVSSRVSLLILHTHRLNLVLQYVM